MRWLVIIIASQLLVSYAHAQQNEDIAKTIDNALPIIEELLSQKIGDIEFKNTDNANAPSSPEISLTDDQQELFGDTPNVESDNKTQTGWSSGSLMYVPEKLEWIKGAIEARETKKPIELILPDLFPTQPRPVKVDVSSIEQVDNETSSLAPAEIIVQESEEPLREVDRESLPSDAPSFFLNSVLELGEGTWSLWIDDKKYIPSQPHPDLEVLDIDDGAVYFLWKTTFLDYISPVWKDHFFHLGSDIYTNHKNIMIDFTKGNIVFVLHPNQSLVTKTMNIREGYVGDADLSSEPSEEQEENSAVQVEDELQSDAVSNEDSSVVQEQPIDLQEQAPKAIKRNLAPINKRDVKQTEQLELLLMMVGDE